MASAAQIVANQRNCRKSTGPRTGEGRVIVSQNAVRHGLSSRRDVIRTEDQGEFDLHSERILDELAPAGPVEAMLAERVVSLLWRLQRAGRIQNQAIDTLITGGNLSPLAKLTQSLLPKTPNYSKSESDADDAKLALGRIAIKDFANSRVLERLLMYERRMEHSLYRSIVEIQRLRLIRQLDPAEGGIHSRAKQGGSL